MGLRARLLFLVLLAVLPGLLLAVLNHVEQRRDGRERVEKDAARIAQLAAASQLALINATRQHLEALARVPDARGNNIAAFEAFFANMKRFYATYTDFGLIETNGTLVACSIPGKTGTNLSHRAVFQRVLTTHEFSVGDYLPPEETGKPSLLFAHPVFDEKKHLTRVLYAALDLDVLSKAAAEAKLPEGGAIEIFDRSGHILARFPEPAKWIGHLVPDLSFRNAVERLEEGTVEGRGLDDLDRLCAFTTVRTGRNPGIYVAVGIPTDLAFGATRQTMVRNLIVLGIVALLALLAAWIYANSYILRPVRQVADAAKRLATGDLSARTGQTETFREFNQLTQAFDDMAASLERQRAEIENSQKQIRTLNASLEQRVAERTKLLEEANAELEAFSYSVSHDLRAPLRHIHGYAEILQEDFGPLLGESGQNTIQYIQRAARRMGMLIDDLLSFSRMSRMEMRRLPVKTDTLVGEVIREMEADLQARNIEWHIESLPEVVADRSMLRQVWANLLGNAVKYTRDREQAQIEIKCARVGSEWEFSVRDNGAGFDMEHADKLFGVFQRLHSEKEFEGLGIGLANVQRIIQRHGGQIRAEGEVDKGAAFYFTLPAA